MTREPWQDYIVNNLGKLIGVFVALLLGWMILEYGIFKTLFVIAMVVVGYLIGKQADDGQDLHSLVDRIFKR